VSVFDVPIKTCLALHIWPIRRTVRLAVRHFFAFFDGHVEPSFEPSGQPSGSPSGSARYASWEAIFVAH
jgi:hypothetical protein